MRIDVPTLRRCVLFGVVLSAAAHLSRAEESAQQVDVFVSGTEGYHTYRIPAIILTNQNTLLAFCEGRKTGASDHGDLDLLLRRSSDGGKTWQLMQLVYEEGGTDKITIGNPCPVVERKTGTIWLPFCRNNDRVFITHSTDDGKSWASPVEITSAVKKPDWGWYATGPGHGIQLASGRLLIPCDHGPRQPTGRGQSRSHAIYSDDLGKSWKLGGIVDVGTNECEVVELADGSLLISMRNHNYRSLKQRALAYSKDGGLTWSTPLPWSDVPCPFCQSSIQRHSLSMATGRNRILYSGPDGSGRKNMTVRLSYDEGKTWPIAKVLYAGSAAYSDLVMLPEGSIGCLYERDGYGKISFARFTLGWLTEGKDKP
jgi:sialidase-1